LGSHCNGKTSGLRVFENRDELTGRLRQLYNEELNDLYSAYIIRVIKSRRIRWVGSVARMGYMRSVYKMLLAKTEGITREA
jgi:hypothetical protein